jgi:hypothetical protein
MAETRMKSLLCAHWLKGRDGCLKGDYCSFAHGTMEIGDTFAVDVDGLVVKTTYLTKDCYRIHGNLYHISQDDGIGINL